MYFIYRTSTWAFVVFLWFSRHYFVQLFHSVLWAVQWSHKWTNYMKGDLMPNRLQRNSKLPLRILWNCSIFVSSYSPRNVALVFISFHSLLSRVPIFLLRYPSMNVNLFVVCICRLLYRVLTVISDTYIPHVKLSLST